MPDGGTITGGRPPGRVRLSVFRHKTETTATIKHASASNIARALTKFEADEKDDLPLVSGAEFNGPRKTENIVSYHAVFGDHDAGTLTLEEAQRRLEAAGVRAVVHESPGSTKETTKLRIIAPLSKPVAPAAYPGLVADLARILGGGVGKGDVLAPESAVTAQCYYIGRVKGTPPRRLVEATGRLRLDEYTPPAGESASPTAEEDGDPVRDYGLEPDLDLTREAAEKIPNSGQAEWNRWKKYLMAFYATGSDGARDHAEQWSRKNTAHDDAVFNEAWKRIIASPPDRIGPGFLRAEIRKAEKATAKRTDLRTWSAAECGAGDPPDLIVQGLAARGDLGCIFGQPGAGKSVAAPHIAYAIAQGRQVFGMHTEPGPVIYVTGEDEYGAQLRVRALRDKFGDAPGFTLVSVSDLLSEDGQFDAVVELVRVTKPVAVFFDTLLACFPGLEENKAESISAVMAKMRRVAGLGSGACVFFVHHTPWGEARTRGHSSLFGTLESAVLIEAGKEGGPTSAGTVVKNKRGRGGRQLAFEVEVVTMGRDKWAGPITTVRAIERDAPSHKPLSSQAQIALGFLETMMEEAGMPTIDVKAWRKRCVESGLMAKPGSTGNAHWQAMRGAMERLIEARRIRVADGFVSAMRQQAVDDTFDDNRSTGGL